MVVGWPLQCKILATPLVCAPHLNIAVLPKEQGGESNTEHTTADVTVAGERLEQEHALKSISSTHAIEY